MSDAQHASPDGRGPAVDPRASAAGHDAAAPEASVDDILASIRRILSEEDPAPAEHVSTHAASPAARGGPRAYERREVPPAAANERAAPHDADDDVLDLHPGMMVQPARRPPEPPHADEHEDEQMSEPDFDTYATPDTPPPTARHSEPGSEQVHELARHMEAQGIRVPESPGLIAPAASAAAERSVGDLVRTLAAERHTAVSRSGPSIEDLVREEIRPVLREWLDTHLPPLVERLVRIEIERVIARGSV